MIYSNFSQAYQYNSRATQICLISLPRKISFTKVKIFSQETQLVAILSLFIPVFNHFSYSFYLLSKYNFSVVTLLFVCVNL